MPAPRSSSSVEGVHGLVLAAGAGRRFGSVKQLAPFAGRPLIEAPVRALRAAGLARVVVVLGFEADLIEGHADLGSVDVVRCGRWAAGIGASLSAGLEALVPGAAEAAVVVLGDQPLIDPRTVRALITARGAGLDAVRATYEGRPGHPVLLERGAWPRLLAADPAYGAAASLDPGRVAFVRCDGLGSDADVDTTEALNSLASGPSAGA
jgi:molybdenum cofactor cytidylyltransferase